MKHLILAIAASLLAFPAPAETLKTSRVIKDAKKVCVDGLRAEGFKQAKPYCNCYADKLTEWVNAAEGVEQQMRLWTIKNDTLPDDVTPDEFFRRAGEAGISRTDMETALIVNYYDVEEFMYACAEPYN